MSRSISSVKSGSSILRAFIENNDGTFLHEFFVSDCLFVGDLFVCVRVCVQRFVTSGTSVIGAVSPQAFS